MIKRIKEKQKLIGSIINKVPDRFEKEVMEAIIFAEEKYLNEKRYSGEDFIIHALNVANYCAQINLDTVSIMTAVLHQTFSLRFNTTQEAVNIKDEIRTKFGEEIYTLLNSLENINYATKINKSVNTEVLRNFIIASTNDIRPLIIKICDILDDSRTLEYLPTDKIKGFCKKVLDVYTPLCEILLLNDIKSEISEIALKKINKDMYTYIVEGLSRRKIDEKLFTKYLEYLYTITDILNYRVKIEGRKKSVYSIYQKFSKYFDEGINPVLDQIKDTIAFRILTKTEKDCFEIADAIKTFTTEYPEKTDDYITNPKPNGYRALQLIVSIPEISPLLIEIQIMTDEMFYFNSYGPASHIAYKESMERFTPSDYSYFWVEDVHKSIQNHINKRETSKSIPITGAIFENRVFVFTPAGLLIELPKDATVLDFAYKIHTSLGDSAVFGEINGATSRLDKKLVTGDVVKIITQKDKKHQSMEALDWVVTETAKKRIKKN